MHLIQLQQYEIALLVIRNIHDESRAFTAMQDIDERNLRANNTTVRAGHAGKDDVEAYHRRQVQNRGDELRPSWDRGKTAAAPVAGITLHAVPPPVSAAKTRGTSRSRTYTAQPPGAGGDGKANPPS